MTTMPHMPESSGQAYAAAFGTLSSAVRLYLDGGRTTEQLEADLAEARAIVDDFYALVDPELQA